MINIKKVKKPFSKTDDGNAPEVRHRSLALIFMFILIFPLVFSLFIFSKPETAEAQVVPFGGLILDRRGCSTSCGHVSGTLLLYVGPPVSAWVMYVPGVSILYPFESLQRGNWVLGIYYPGTASICWRRDSGRCFSNGWAWGNINMVGTSL